MFILIHIKIQNLCLNRASEGFCVSKNQFLLSCRIVLPDAISMKNVIFREKLYEELGLESIQQW